MPQRLLDWLQLPARDVVAPYRRMLANALGFPATPAYGNDDKSHDDTATKTTEQPKLLTAPATSSPRKKRRSKKRRRRRAKRQ